MAKGYAPGSARGAGGEMRVAGVGSLPFRPSTSPSPDPTSPLADVTAGASVTECRRDAVEAAEELVADKSGSELPVNFCLASRVGLPVIFDLRSAGLGVEASKGIDSSNSLASLATDETAASL